MGPANSSDAKAVQHADSGQRKAAWCLPLSLVSRAVADSMQVQCAHQQVAVCMQLCKQSAQPSAHTPMSRRSMQVATPPPSVLINLSCREKSCRVGQLLAQPAVSHAGVAAQLPQLTQLGPRPDVTGGGPRPRPRPRPCSSPDMRATERRGGAAVNSLAPPGGAMLQNRK